MAKEKNLNKVTETSSGLQGQYKNWFLDYASYVILERAVPAIEDGAALGQVVGDGGGERNSKFGGRGTRSLALLLLSHVAFQCCRRS